MSCYFLTILGKSRRKSLLNEGIGQHLNSGERSAFGKELGPSCSGGHNSHPRTSKCRLHTRLNKKNTGDQIVLQISTHPAVIKDLVSDLKTASPITHNNASRRIDLNQKSCHSSQQHRYPSQTLTANPPTNIDQFHPGLQEVDNESRREKGVYR